MRQKSEILRINVVLVLISLFLPCIVHGQVPKPVSVPVGLPDQVRVALVEKYDVLSDWAIRIEGGVKDQRAQCRNVNMRDEDRVRFCQEWSDMIVGEYTKYSNAVKAFKWEVLEKSLFHVENIQMERWNHFEANVAVVGAVKAPVFVKRGNGWVTFDGETPIETGDEVRTGPNGFMELIFTDGSIVRLDANSSFVPLEMTEKKSIFEFITGRIHAQYLCMKNRRDICRPIKYRAHNIGFSPRGTEFQAEISPDGKTTILVMEGTVEITPIKSNKIVVLKPGEQAIVTKDGELQELLPVDLRKIDRWWEAPVKNDDV